MRRNVVSFSSSLKNRSEVEGWSVSIELLLCAVLSKLFRTSKRSRLQGALAISLTDAGLTSLIVQPRLKGRQTQALAD